MNWHIKFLFCICIFFVLSTYVSCIKCWTCRADYDPNCGEPFNNASIPLTNCNYERDLDEYPGLEPNSCLKMVQNIDEHPVLFRGCAWKQPYDYTTTCPSTADGPNDLVSECVICQDRDGCNEAQQHQLGFGVMVLTLIFTTVCRIHG